MQSFFWDCFNEQEKKMSKSRVAVLRTKPESVLEDYQKLCNLAGNTAGT